MRRSLGGDRQRVPGIDDDARLSGNNPADHRCAIEVTGVERAQHVVDRVGRTCNQQSTRSLRIGEQRTLRGVKIAVDLVAITRPVAARRAGDEAGASQRGRIGQ